jgi:hypothetical protein
MSKNVQSAYERMMQKPENRVVTNMEQPTMDELEKSVAAQTSTPRDTFGDRLDEQRNKRIEGLKENVDITTALKRIESRMGTIEKALQVILEQQRKGR